MIRASKVHAVRIPHLTITWRNVTVKWYCLQLLNGGQLLNGCYHLTTKYTRLLNGANVL